MRLEDEEAGAVSDKVVYDEYLRPIETLTALRESAFDLERRMGLLRDLVRHLKSQGKEIDAIRLVMPLLLEGRLPEDMAQTLVEDIWSQMPDAMRQATEEGDFEFALMVYESFGSYLDRLPRKDDLLLECARILLDSGLREHARRPLDRMSPYPSLSAAQQMRRSLIERELELNPDDPENLKRLAPDILHPDYDESIQARVIGMLARVYSKEGNHSRAAEIYLKGVDLKSLDWRRRVEFYELAAQEHEDASNYAKTIEIGALGIRDFEQSGYPAENAESLFGAMLLRMGHAHLRLGDPAAAEKAFEQYLRNYPQGPYADSAKYFLALSVEEKRDPAKALEIYEELAKGRGQDSFWSGAAGKTGEHLRWGAERPYLMREEALP
jgi:TolA-binding protein